MKVMTGTREEFRAWLELQPENVQRLALEFPVGAAYRVDRTAERLIVIGYTHCDLLVMSSTDPREAYDESVMRKVLIPAQSVREDMTRTGVDDV